MKFQLHFKTPDVIGYALDSLDQLDKDERAEVVAFCKKWVKWEECVTIEFDTEAGTAIVQES